MFWFTLAGMTFFAVLIAVLPLLLRRPPRNLPRSDIAFYNAQLAEIDRDLERGQLPESEAGTARAETARRLLAANASTETSALSDRGGWNRRLAAILTVLIIPMVGLGVYLHFGNPGVPDAPLASREEAAPEPDPVAQALAHIEAEVAASPDNDKAWAALAPAYIRLGRYGDAVIANRNLLRIKGEDGNVRANLGEAEVAAAAGKVTDEARADFEKALAAAPDSVMARFYLGLADEQAGNPKKALEAYEPLIEQAKDHPHWAAIIQARISALKGVKPADAATSSAAGVPDSQKAMVTAMVEKLAGRLAQSGGGVDDWVRLVHSYSVLDEKDKAKEALASARKALSADASASAKLDSAEQEINQPPAPEASQNSPPESSQNPAPAAAQEAKAPESQGDMVNAMVNRLATRLAQGGGSVDDWLRLVRSYSVLNNKDKAREALASAHKSLNADAGAGEKLDALARELNLSEP
jgi:cytochrome c-type biogenesis protein CcmH